MHNFRHVPSFPPLFAPCEWWRLRIALLMNGYRHDLALTTANKEAIDRNIIQPRSWMRFSVNDISRGSLTLSMPIKGGASALKNHHPDSWLISPHGDAPYAIDATLATLYGSTPFFHIIAPSVSLRILHPLSPVSDLCLRLDKIIMNLLDPPESGTITHLAALRCENPKLYTELRSEYSASANGFTSILESLFSFGKDTIYHLAPPLD